MNTIIHRHKYFRVGSLRGGTESLPSFFLTSLVFIFDSCYTYNTNREKSLLWFDETQSPCDLISQGLCFCGYYILTLILILPLSLVVPVPTTTPTTAPVPPRQGVLPTFAALGFSLLVIVVGTTPPPL